MNSWFNKFVSLFRINHNLHIYFARINLPILIKNTVTSKRS